MVEIQMKKEVLKISQDDVVEGNLKQQPFSVSCITGLSWVKNYFRVGRNLRSLSKR